MTVPVFLALFMIGLSFCMFMEIIHDWPRFGSGVTILLLLFYSIVFLTQGDKPVSTPPGVTSIQSKSGAKICEGESK
jgi:hypothetical protein